MGNMIYNFTHKQFSLVKKCILAVVLLGTSTCCFANSLNNEELISISVNQTLWQKINLKEENTASRSALKDGTFTGYSHNFRKYFGLDVSVDSYIYTNESDNSFAWAVGFVGKLFKLNYHIDQEEKNEYVEVITHYPLNGSLSLTGYAGKKYVGEDEYQDYSVGLAFSLNKSVEISAGFADREFKKIDAENNVFLNINGTF
jgi:hypothetical protein